jgi:hypothetical protein
MSSISALGGSGLAQYLTGVAKQKTKQASTKALAAKNAGSTNSTTAANGSSFANQLEATVTSALQQAKATGSTKDPNQIVEDSIASLLKNVLSGKSPPPASGPASPTTQLAFQAALKSAGITSQQFQSDYKAAVDDAQNSTATQLPKGSNLDVTG